MKETAYIAREGWLAKLRRTAETIQGGQVLCEEVDISLMESMNARFGLRRPSEALADVTCCIPFGGGHPFLKDAIDSVHAQTNRPREIIVGIDGTAARLDFADDLRVKIFSWEGEKSGPFALMTKLIMMASSKYILCLDSDDLSHPERIAHLVAHAESKNLDVLGSAAGYFDVPDGRIQEFGVFPLVPLASLEREMCHAILYGTCLIKREFFTGIGGFSRFEEFGMDSEFLLRAIRYGRVENLPLPLYFVRRRPDSLTSNIRTGMLSLRRQSVLDFTCTQYYKLFQPSIRDARF